jgi:hypothetical protein
LPGQHLAHVDLYHDRRAAIEHGDGLLSCSSSVATALLAFLRSKYGSDGVSVVNMADAPSTYCGQRWTFAPDNRSVAVDQHTFIDALVERTGRGRVRAASGDDRRVSSDHGQDHPLVLGARVVGDGVQQRLE